MAGLGYIQYGWTIITWIGSKTNGSLSEAGQVFIWIEAGAKKLVQDAYQMV